MFHDRRFVLQKQAEKRAVIQANTDNALAEQPEAELTAEDMKDPLTKTLPPREEKPTLENSQRGFLSSFPQTQSKRPVVKSNCKRIK